MNKTTITTTLIVCATILLTAAWLTDAGPINPPAGPVASTGVTTQELADLIAGSDPCECDGYTWGNAQTASSSTVLLSTSKNYYIKRVSISKTSAVADVSLSLREPGALNFGFYRLRPDEGSLVADVDLVVNGMQTQSLTVNSGLVLIAYYYKEVP